MANRVRLKRGGTRDAHSVNRLGGAPIGVRARQWPRYHDPETGEDRPMAHVITVNVEELGLAGTPGLRPDTRALAVFTTSPEMPIYFDDPTSDYTVLQLSQEDVARGELDEGVLEGSEALPAYPLELVPVTRAPSNNRAGFAPRYIQEDGGSADFVFQAEEGLLGVNLGDSGTLYVYTTWAMWQCY